MGFIDVQIQKLSRAEKEVEDVAKLAISENEDYVIRILQGRLSKGLDSENRIIGRYSPNTEKYAAKDKISTPKNPGSPYNLYWSGETMENIRIKSINKHKATINMTTVPKMKKMLEGMYGEIFELSEENMNQVIEEIIEPAMYKFILQSLSL